MAQTKAKNVLADWSTRDIMVLVAIVVALAVLSLVAIYVRTFLEAALGPFGNRLAMVSSIVIVLTPPFLIRKPFSAILAALLLGLTQIPFSPAGVIAIVGFLVGGIVSEIIFAAGRYRSYSLRFMLIAGVVYNFFTLLVAWIPYQYSALSVIGIIGVLIATVIGGLVAGWLIYMIGESLRQSGILADYTESEG